LAVGAVCVIIVSFLNNFTINYQSINFHVQLISFFKVFALLAMAVKSFCHCLIGGVYVVANEFERTTAPGRNVLFDKSACAFFES